MNRWSQALAGQPPDNYKSAQIRVLLVADPNLSVATLAQHLMFCRYCQLNAFTAFSLYSGDRDVSIENHGLYVVTKKEQQKSQQQQENYT